MYTHILILWINKDYQLFRNLMYDVTLHNPFGSGLKAVNEVGRHIVCILDDIIVILKQRQYNIYCVWC